MKSLGRLVLVLTITTSLTYGAETAIWDTVNNTVTYANSVAGVTANDPATSLLFSQFNSANAVTAGEAPGTYTLTRAVIAINGSIAGTFTFTNVKGGNHDVKSAASASEFTFSAGGSQVAESFFDQVAPPKITIGAGQTKTFLFSDSGSATAVTKDITDELSLANFTGSGSLSTFVNLVATATVNAHKDIDSLLTATGSANVSITYYYEGVPEPTSLALLGLGCAAVALRRRRVVKA